MTTRITSRVASGCGHQPLLGRRSVTYCGSSCTGASWHGYSGTRVAVGCSRAVRRSSHGWPALATRWISTCSTFWAILTMHSDCEARCVQHRPGHWLAHDHIADKLCATQALYGPMRRPSSRTRDLVDLVTFARTQDVDGADLTAAIEGEVVPPKPSRAPILRPARRLGDDLPLGGGTHAVVRRTDGIR